ncbi:MAG: penicillin-binding transpeptidase domain-containing protein [Pseudomonadota bacterium]
MAKEKRKFLLYRYRITFVSVIFFLIAAALLWRVVDLKIVRQEFLQGQSNARVVRNLETAAHRGMIVDRNGEPLAISTPVVTVWANPSEMDLTQSKIIIKLADLLKVNRKALQKKLQRKKRKSFIYLKRRINPDIGKKVAALDIKGVFLQREYRRYYPSAEVSGHIIGFTNIDEKGIEGLELLYDQWLSGVPGKKRVIRDRLGRVIAIDDNKLAPQPGKSLTLSLDRRVQYLAYAELKKAIKKHKAKSGSAVILDITTGEVIAMVNQPGFNPNKLSDRKPENYKNRAVTNQYEPGSTVKPLTIMAALESKQFSTATMVETGDGWFVVGRKTIRDTHANGTIDLSTIIQKSSNVGTSKVALKLPKEMLWNTFSSFGFGQDTGSNFPGEVFGRLIQPRRIHKIEQVTLSFGYGLTSTALQLAQVYSTIARYGKIIPVSYLKVDEKPELMGSANVSEKNIKTVIKMMERVLKPGGTAAKIAIPGYRVAGKTGTVKKASRSGGYAEKKYMAVFAGFAPVSKPRLAMAIMIDEPTEGGYYGGTVAGPVFKNVMSGALRLLDVSPDNIKKRITVSVVNKQIESVINKYNKKHRIKKADSGKPTIGKQGMINK